MPRKKKGMDMARAFALVLIKLGAISNFSYQIIVIASMLFVLTYNHIMHIKNCYFS